MSESEPWRDPSRLTEEDKARLDRLTDRKRRALDVTSDEHEYVWGFRQDREHERRREMASEAAFTREQMHERLGGNGHAMSWHPASDDPAQILRWNGECTDCGANASASAASSSMWRSGKDARTAACSGPGTAWQDAMLRERQDQLIAGDAAEFGQAVKDIYDREWLAGQGIEIEMEAG